MTNEMRARVKRAVEMSNGNLTIESAKASIAQKESVIRYYDNLPSWKQGYSEKCAIATAKSEIAYYEVVIEYLTELEAAEVVAETVQVLAAIITVANKAKAVRRAVATLANKLHRLNYSLSDAFKRAWTFIRAFTGLIPSLA